ncbi:MAG: cell division protein ZapA [Vicinamibacterales bacterium]
MTPGPSPSRVVTVEIQGQRYPVRSDLDAGYVADLAAYVDAKMRLASSESSAADSMRLAVIAALNIADELFRAREEAAGGAGTYDALLDRAAELERILDAVLAGRDGSEPARARVV